MLIIVDTFMNVDILIYSFIDSIKGGMGLLFTSYYNYITLKYYNIINYL